MSKLEDLSGQRFGRLVVLYRDTKSKPSGGTKWICLCDCGNTKSVVATNLKNRRTRSCGCLQSELTSLRCKTHGDGSGCRLFRIWKAMKSRCYYERDVGYHLYGGRGISVCDLWRGSYASFKEWALKNGYSEKLTLDRIDPNGNYEPSNCRWATYKEQCNNKRGNVHITYNGETHTLSEWAEITGIKIATLANRKRLGWSDSDCIEIPVVRGNNQKTRKNKPKRKE